MKIETLSFPASPCGNPEPPNPEGECVVYCMQRAQRALDNPALDVAVELGNELGKPVVVFLAPMPFYPHLTCVTGRKFDAKRYIAQIGELERAHV